MHPFIVSILKALGTAILVVLILNLCLFGYDLLINGVTKIWHFKFHNGTFYSNGRPTGLILGDPSANRIMFVMFVVSIYKDYKQGLISLSNRRNSKNSLSS